MSIRWNQSALNLMEREAAKRLLVAATTVATEHRGFLSVANAGVRVKRTRTTPAGKKGSSYTIYPNPSKPGEYPRRVTGAGTANVATDCSTIGEVIANGFKIRVGLKPAGKHLAILELFRQRLGFAETAKRLKQTVMQILNG